MRLAQRGMIAAAIGLAVGFAGTAAHAQKVNYGMQAVAVSQSVAFVADAMGFWKNQGLDVGFVTVAGAAALPAVIGGDVQFGTAPGPTLLAAVAHGQPLIAIASVYNDLLFELDISNAAAAKTGLTLKDSTVMQRAKAIKGMTIAIDEPNTAVDGFLKHIAVMGGLDPAKDLTTPPMPPTSVVSAMEQKQIDGFVASPPWTSLPQAQGTGIIWISAIRRDLPDLSPFAFGSIITNPNYCQKNAETCRKFVKGIQESIAYMKSNPDKSLDLIRPKFTGMDPAILKNDFDNQAKLLAPNGAFSDVGYSNAQRFDIETGVLKPSEARQSFAGALYTNAYLQ